MKNKKDLAHPEMNKVQNYAVLSLANAKRFCQREDKFVLLEQNPFNYFLLLIAA